VVGNTPAPPFGSTYLEALPYGFGDLIGWRSRSTRRYVCRPAHLNCPTKRRTLDQTSQWWCGRAWSTSIRRCRPSLGNSTEKGEETGRNQTPGTGSPLPIVNLAAPIPCVSVGRASTRRISKGDWGLCLPLGWPEVIVKTQLHESNPLAPWFSLRTAIFVVRPGRDTQQHIRAARKAECCQPIAVDAAQVPGNYLGRTTFRAMCSKL